MHWNYIQLLSTIFSVCILNTSCDYKNPYMFDTRNSIVHLFEWKFSDIAEECVFLGERGYGGVQLSPVQESKREESHSWYLRYQPVSYQIISRSGNLEELQNMTKVCQENRIRVYVDVVINQMAEGEDEVVGYGGSKAYPSRLEYPEVPYQPEDFNEFCFILNTTNPFEIRNCRLAGLPDLNQAKENVKAKVVEFMNTLIDAGVAGFRIDATKHMWPADLVNIYNELKDLNTAYGFPPKARPFIYQAVSDMGGEAVSKTEYIGDAAVTEFMHSQYISLVFGGKKPLHELLGWGPKKGFAPSRDAIVFVDNQDNQRQDSTILNFKNKRDYILANVFMLSHPYGIPRVMSSFDYERNDQGPPSDEDGNIVGRMLDENGTCIHPWICEHRWKPIASMVEFRSSVGNEPIANWADNGQNQITFCRGNLGFVAINHELSLNLKTNVKACVPEGVYCDVISGEKVDGDCTGDKIVVDSNNKVDIVIQYTKDIPAVAIHVNSKL